MMDLAAIEKWLRDNPRGALELYYDVDYEGDPKVTVDVIKFDPQLDDGQIITAAHFGDTLQEALEKAIQS